MPFFIAMVRPRRRRLNFMAQAIPADVDKDNDVDVIGVDKYESRITLWQKYGQQNFTAVVIDSAIGWPVSADIADLDTDTLNFYLRTGEEQTVSVTCTAAEMYNGSYAGVLEIRSNDPDSPVYSVPLLLEMSKGQEVHFTAESEPNNSTDTARKLLLLR